MPTHADRIAVNDMEGVDMPTWRYRVTVHSADEILQHLGEEIEQIPSSIYCDDKGTCFFDEGPNPLTMAVEEILNNMGGRGWELVHVAFKPDQMICFWKQSQ
jgi:hypothetical protein